jgi:hypothetical protein
MTPTAPARRADAEIVPLVRSMPSLQAITILREDS